MTEQLIAEWTTENGVTATMTGSGPLAEAMATIKRPVEMDDGYDPDDRIPVPGPVAMMDSEYLTAPELAEIGARLIEERPALEHLRGAAIDYLWRAKAAKKAGRSLWVKAAELSGYGLHYARGPRFVVEVAANLSRARELTFAGAERLIFRGLCHIGRVIDNRGLATLAIVPADHSIFEAEIDAFGLYDEDLARLGQRMRQVPITWDGVLRP